MRILLRYLRPQRGLVLFSLGLAAASRVLALFDPVVFGWIVDRYATPPFTLSAEQRVEGALNLLLLAVILAVLSRLAKTLQEYVTNLVGLYLPVEGQVLYNNHPGTDIWLNEARRQLGFVTQETNLFSGTIRDNLLFVKPDATDEEAIAAMDKASCLNLLERTGEGLGTPIGEGGMKMSGGEKQRLSIARSLLRNPRLLIFDEATSALDSLTEEEITSTVREISAFREQITILIAHRLSTIMHADTIHVLERGQIVESGSHQHLLDLKGLYYAMWRQQIGERK